MKIYNLYGLTCVRWACGIGPKTLIASYWENRFTETIGVAPRNLRSREHEKMHVAALIAAVICMKVFWVEVWKCTGCYAERGCRVGHARSLQCWSEGSSFRAFPSAILRFDHKGFLLLPPMFLRVVDNRLRLLVFLQDLVKSDMMLKRYLSFRSKRPIRSLKVSYRGASNYFLISLAKVSKQTLSKIYPFMWCIISIVAYIYVEWILGSFKLV